MLFVRSLKKRDLLKMLQLLSIFACLQSAGSVCVYVHVQFSIKINLLRKTLWLKKGDKREAGWTGCQKTRPESLSFFSVNISELYLQCTITANNVFS